MKKINIFVLLFALLCWESALAAGFGYMDIEWSDNGKQIIEKMSSNGLASKVGWKGAGENLCQDEYYGIFNNTGDTDRHSQEVKRMSQYIYAINKTEFADSSRLKVIEFSGNGTTGPLSGSFYISCKTDKLMAYEVNIDDQITEKEEYLRYGDDNNDAPENLRSENPAIFNHYSMTFMGLLNKYGLPTSYVSKGEKWVMDDQALYYVSTLQGIRLVFYNEKNITEHANYIIETIDGPR